MSGERLTQAIEAIDRANREDPNFERVGDRDFPRELLYSERMTCWLLRLCPEASEAQQLAARAQHIRRWQIPRGDYPPTREGYLRWRTQLYRFHSEQAASILSAQGYDPATIDDVRRMVGKQGIKRETNVQLIEDVACLVFLEFYFPAFAQGNESAKVVDIVRKTWRKMSEQAHSAVREIAFPEHIVPLLETALNSETAA